MGSHSTPTPLPLLSHSICAHLGVQQLFRTAAALPWGHCTVGPMTMKSTRRVLGHSLLRSLVRSHRSLIRLLRTARFARALRCAHLFARSLTHSLQSSWERDLCLRIKCVNFIQF